MTKVLFVVFSLCFLMCGTAKTCNAKDFILDNGYKVEFNWKVKGKELRMWGSVKGGNDCERLIVNAYLKNERYNGSARLSTFIKRKHSRYSRSVYKGQSNIRSNKHKKGWYVMDLRVGCSNVNPLN